MGRTRFFPIFFWTSRCPWRVSRKYSEVWLRKVNIKSNLTSKAHPTLKLSSRRQLRKLYMFPHESPKLHAVFERQALKFVTHVFYEPFSTPERRAFIFCPPEVWDSLRSKLKKKNDQISTGKTTTTTPSVNGLRQGLREDVHVRNFLGLSLKTGVDFRILKWFIRIL